MKAIFEDLSLNSTDILDSIIVYPKIESENINLDEKAFNTKQELKDYYNLYRLEVELPILKTN
jgi:hypothetical protein